jgi:two-component system OmpR family response regulator
MRHRSAAGRPFRGDFAAIHRFAMNSRRRGYCRSARRALPRPTFAGKEIPMSEADEKGDSTQPQPARILIIDDNRDAADTLAMLLRVWGFDTRTAYDGPEGLQAAHDYRPQIILSDIGLPRLDGYRLAEAIRRDESLKGIPLIAISASYDPAKATGAGFDHHFVKPVAPSILRSVLQKLQTMDKNMQRAEKVLEQQGEVVRETKELMKEVKSDLKEMKQEIKEVKEDVKSVKDDLRELKERDEK